MPPSLLAVAASVAPKDAAQNFYQQYVKFFSRFLRKLKFLDYFTQILYLPSR